MIKAIIKFPLYLIWFAILLPLLRVLAIPVLIVAYLLLCCVMGLGWVWEKARYGTPKTDLGCD